MLKVFLVEDEIVVREGIKRKIDWSREGFAFVGEASDGELALPMIQKLKPDILITDIKMPFMDGLELSRLVKKELPNIKIIILSGYNEFEYAKEAITIQVTEYLLKPITSDKLLQSVKEVAEVIEKENGQAEYVEQFRKEMLENKQLEKRKFFSDLVCRELSLTEIANRADSLEMNLVAQNYNMILFKLMISGKTIVTYSEEVLRITECMEQYVAGREHIFMFDRSADGWAFLLKDDSAEELLADIQACKEELVRLVAPYPKMEYFGGVGKPVQRLRELPDSFEEANKAFSYRYLEKSNQIISYDRAKKMGLLWEEEIDFTSLDVGKIDRKILENFLRSGSIEEVRHFLSDYFEELGEVHFNSMMFRQYVVMDMYFCTVAFAEELGLDSKTIKATCGEFKEISVILTDMKATKAYLEKLITQSLQVRDKLSMKRYGDLLDQAKQYIKENYAAEAISLNTVAASVNVSPSYFSTVFSQEMGETFIEYLTHVRMDKAKELLMCTTMKSSDIGYEVGYKDSHYFSYLFKKLQDCTPREFRMRGKDKG